jgi:hypothetical protein
VKNKVFLDASYAIALSNLSDQYHLQAETIAEKLEVKGTKLITTQAVILEIGNALAKLRYRKAAVELINSLENDISIEIVPLTNELYKRAFRFYKERLDKEWGLTDCISFVVMQDYNLTEALTADEHFEQAGFRILLK